jgi:hypothetical protein
MKLEQVLSILRVALPSGAAAAMLTYVAATRGYAVDWDATGTMLQGQAAILGAIAALWGVNQWRKELRYKRNSELAVQVMVAVEGLVWCMQQARRFPEPFEVDPEHGTGRVLHRFSYESRIEKLKQKDYYSELTGLANHVAAMFGQDHRKAIEELTAIYVTLSLTLEQTLGMLKVATEVPPLPNLDVNEGYGLIERLAPTIFAPAGNDGIGKGIDLAATRIRALFATSM